MTNNPLAPPHNVARKERGFTLTEFLIYLAAVTAVAVFLGSLLQPSCLLGSEEHAEQQAREHADKLGWKVTGVACVNTDTNGDGYISCTLVLDDGTERALACAAGDFLSRVKGCKKAPLVQESQGASSVMAEEWP